MQTLFADPNIRMKLLMLFILPFILFKPIRSIVLGRSSTNWRRVKATVITSSLDRESGTYYPNIIYSYSVSGRDFTDGNYTFAGAKTNGKSTALAIVQDHPVGKEIQIYVDPNKPTKSVVVPGVLWPAYANTAFLLVFFLGIAFIVDILNFIWPGCKPNCT